MAKQKRRVIKKGKRGKKKTEFSERAFVVSLSHLADLLGSHRNTVAKWIEKGMPGAGPDGYCVPQCVRWMIDQAKDSDSSALQPETEWTPKIQEQDFRKKKRLNDEAEGLIIALQDLRKWWVLVSGRLRRAIEAIERRWGFDEDTPGAVIREAFTDADRIVQENVGDE